MRFVIPIIVLVMIGFWLPMSQTFNDMTWIYYSLLEKTGIKSSHIPKNIPADRYNDLLALYPASPDKKENALRIMSFNVRFDAEEDKGEQKWKKRLPRIIEMIRFYKPDIIGTQELLNNQRKDLIYHLPEYNEFGESRGKDYLFGLVPTGEFNSIFYKKKRLKLLKHNTFWLNKNKQRGKIGWDAMDPRISTWGEFFDKATQKHFWYFNTHLDHYGKNARINGIQLIIDTANKKKDFEGDLIFIGGDFNDYQGEVMASARKQGFTDTIDLTESKEGPRGTYTSWGKPKRRIDFILINQKDLPITRHVTVDHEDRFEKPLSDHLPIFIDIQLIQ